MAAVNTVIELFPVALPLATTLRLYPRVFVPDNIDSGLAGDNVIVYESPFPQVNTGDVMVPGTVAVPDGSISPNAIVPVAVVLLPVKEQAAFALYGTLIMIRKISATIFPVFICLGIIFFT